LPYYTGVLQVPADTKKDEPKEQGVEVERGILSRLSIHFPPGCRSMVHVTLFYGIKQIAPSKEGMSFLGDGETLEYEPLIQMPDDPTRLTWKGWSPDTHYDHGIVWRLEVKKEEEAKPWVVIEGFVRILRRLMGV